MFLGSPLKQGLPSSRLRLTAIDGPCQETMDLVYHSFPSLTLRSYLIHHLAPQVSNGNVGLLDP
jgi:hypothetical protein